MNARLVPSHGTLQDEGLSCRGYWRVGTTRRRRQSLLRSKLCLRSRRKKCLRLKPVSLMASRVFPHMR